MFTFAILIGIYSYIIFTLGLLGILYKEYIIFLTIAFFLVFAVNLSRTQNAETVKSWVRGLPRSLKTFKQIHRLNVVFLILLFFQTVLLYTAALALSNEIGAKLIHFSFGILSMIALYRISRKFLPKTFSLLVLVLFYSNLVVGWMSITKVKLYSLGGQK